eukprot:TRINITY_DN34315_c0_g1_i1.p1 TRINITY_DN34315_c0_g1~~TRINITY_DN34315_c0_g1_i1.p1  ORF type:complete len:1219 (+),score=144.95 TRINITY_DN34315_c0_g1_i1:276-3932(+)
MGNGPASTWTIAEDNVASEVVSPGMVCSNACAAVAQVPWMTRTTGSTHSSAQRTPCGDTTGGLNHGRSRRGPTGQSHSPRVRMVTTDHEVSDSPRSPPSSSLGKRLHSSRSHQSSVGRNTSKRSPSRTVVKSETSLQEECADIGTQRPRTCADDQSQAMWVSGEMCQSVCGIRDVEVDTRQSVPLPPSTARRGYSTSRSTERTSYSSRSLWPEMCTARAYSSASSPWSQRASVHPSKSSSRFNARRSASVKPVPCANACRTVGPLALEPLSCLCDASDNKDPILVIETAPESCTRQEVSFREKWIDTTSDVIEVEHASEAFERIDDAYIVPSKCRRAEAQMIRNCSPLHNHDVSELVADQTTREEAITLLERPELKRRKKHRELMRQHDHETSFKHTDATAAHWNLPRLIKAVQNLNFEELRMIAMNDRHQLERTDRFKQTALFWACGGPPTESGKMVMLLTRARAKVDIANAFGYTPIMRALCHGQIQAAEHLLQIKARVDTRDHLGGSCLSMAAAAGQSEAVKWLAERETDVFERLLDAEDVDQTRPLHCSARGGHQDICCFLIKMRASVHVEDAAGRTPLLFALARNHTYIAKVMIENKADIKGRLLVHQLILNMAKFQAYKNTTLCGLSAALELKANVDSTDGRRRTPLLVALFHDLPSAVALLALNGANVCTMDEKDRSALFIARETRKVQIVQILFDFGATRRSNIAADKALVRAVFYGNERACNTLIERQANPNVTEISAASSNQRFRGQPEATSDERVDCVAVAKRMGHFQVTRLLDAARDANNAKTTSDQGIAGNEFTDPVRVQCWQEAFASRCNTDSIVQRAILSDDSKHLIETCQVLEDKYLQEDKILLNTGITASLLREHLTFMAQGIPKIALSYLRVLRGQSRAEKMHACHQEVHGWIRQRRHAKNVEGLISLYERFKAPLSTSEATAWEMSFPICAESETMQERYIGAVMRRFAEIVDDMKHEEIVIDSMPSLKRHVSSQYVADEICKKVSGVVQKLNVDVMKTFLCPRCLSSNFGSSAAAAAHAKACTSSIGDHKKQEVIAGRLNLYRCVVLTINHLGTRYERHSDAIKELIAEAKEAQRQSEKRFPEVSCVINCCTEFLRVLHEICTDRHYVCFDFCRQEGPLAKIPEGVIEATRPTLCRLCLEGKVTRTIIHSTADAAAPEHSCTCLCSPCGDGLESQIEMNMFVECPQCRRKANRISSVT